MSNQNASSNASRLDRYGRRRVIVVYTTFVVIALCMFAGAGTVLWGVAWAYTLISAAVTTVAVRLMSDSAQVINARGRNNRPQERWDRIIMSIYTPLPLIQFVLAGLDAVRFEWSGMAVGWRVPGWALCLASMIFIYWSMACNPYLETTVRIQSDRGQTVADRGPYRIVRHPMYVGMLVSLLGTPLVLGSWWALLPGVLGCGLLIARTAREDAMLQRELDGYAAYAHRTRARLLPGVW